MTPLIILTVSSGLLRLIGYFGVKQLESSSQSIRLGIVIMFLFTGATHFSEMKYDYAAMIPPPFTGALWLVFVSGILEIAGAIGVLLKKTRRLAGIGLMVLLFALFPANIYAAINDIPFRGESPSELWLRAPIQIVFALAIWWSTLRKPPAAT